MSKFKFTLVIITLVLGLVNLGLGMYLDDLELHVYGLMLMVAGLVIIITYILEDSRRIKILMLDMLDRLDEDVDVFIDDTKTPEVHDD